MRDYQPNSHKSKESEVKNNNSSEAKRVKKVVNGKVRTKKNEGRKLASMFISEDAANVKSFIILDVLIPAVKKAVWDIITNGADMILYGGKGGGKNKSGTKISYRNYYDEPRERNQRTVSRFDYDDLIFNSREECESVREQMIDLIETYNFVTVADMYDMAGLSAPYTSNKYGWTNIRTAETVRVRDGYILKLPKAMPID